MKGVGLLLVREEEKEKINTGAAVSVESKSEGGVSNFGAVVQRICAVPRIGIYFAFWTF
jgi:hypothetical protein